MRIRVPEVKRCCCCIPLRHGIIVFGLIDIIFSLLAVTCLVITTELKKSKLIDGSSLEVVTSTILFSIFGMSIIVNIMLLFAGCQKDILMLRLYLYYGVVTTLAALVPTFILLSRMMTFDVCTALIAICIDVPQSSQQLPFLRFLHPADYHDVHKVLGPPCVPLIAWHGFYNFYLFYAITTRIIRMQWYVIILVRSEIVKLEQASLRAEDSSPVHEVAIDVPDRDTLL